MSKTHNFTPFHQLPGLIHKNAKNKWKITEI